MINGMEMRLSKHLISSIAVRLSLLREGGDIVVESEIVVMPWPPTLAERGFP
jgi:hypothetical protein